MGKYYAVAKGRSNGVYNNWADCKNQIDGFSGARFKSFATQQEAAAFAAGKSGSGGSAIPGPSARTSRRSTRGPYDRPVGRPQSRSYTKSQPKITSSSEYATRREVSEDCQVIYTDGSSLGNGKKGARAGWGVYWGPNDPRNASGKVEAGEQTNNRGELEAIQVAVREISKDAQRTKNTSYEVRADSQYARDSLGKWSDNWERNGWKTSTGSSVKNQDLIASTRQEIRDLRASGVDIKIEYVPGHAGHSGNEAADQLARNAASS